MFENGYIESSFSIQKNDQCIIVSITKNCILHWILGIQLLLYGKSDSIVLHDVIASDKIKLCIKNGIGMIFLANINLRITQNDLEALESLLLDYLTDHYFWGMHLDLECMEIQTNICYDITVQVTPS